MWRVCNYSGDWHQSRIARHQSGVLHEWYQAIKSPFLKTFQVGHVDEGKPATFIPEIIAALPRTSQNSTEVIRGTKVEAPLV